MVVGMWVLGGHVLVAGRAGSEGGGTLTSGKVPLEKTLWRMVVSDDAR